MRAEIQRVDRAEKAAAEGRARCGERAVRVDRQLGAVRGEAGHERRRNGARKIAAKCRCAEKKDFRLIGVDEFRHAPRVGFVSVIGEDRALNKIRDICAMSEGFGHRLAGFLSRSAEDDAGKLNAELVSKLTAFSHQLPGNGMHNAAFELYEDPHMLVGLEALRQLFLHSGAAASSRLGSGFCGHEMISLCASALGQVRQFLLERRQPLENFFDRVRRHLVGGKSGDVDLVSFL